MPKPLIVAVAGDANSGKSTFLNSCMGMMLMSVKYVCETALLVWVAPKQAHGEPIAKFADGSSAHGANDIQMSIKSRNQAIRKNGVGQPGAEVVSLECGLVPGLQELEAGPDERLKMKFVDMPGPNEIGSPHMRQCAEDAYAHSDAMVVLMNLYQIKAQATEDLLKHVREIAPFHFTNTDRVDNLIICITHADACVEDSDNEDTIAEHLATLKEELRATLSKMQCLEDIPKFVANVPIAAINAKKLYNASGAPQLDWALVETRLKRMVAAAPALIRRRQVDAGRHLRKMIDFIFLSKNVGNVYPDRAREVRLAAGHVDNAGSDHRSDAGKNNKVLVLRAAALGLGIVVVGSCIFVFGVYGTALVLVKATYVAAVPGHAAIPAHAAISAGWFGLGNFITIPAIGLTASAPAFAGVPAVIAVPASVGTALTATGLAALSGTTAAVVAAGTTYVAAPGMCAFLEETSPADVGALTSDQALAAARTHYPSNEEDIRAGYKDVLHYDGNINGAPVLYIGAWKDNKPHGEGQIFWQDGTPAFTGEMRNGKMSKGYLIDERSRVHGRYRFSYHGDSCDVELDGFQPGDGEDDGMCVICMAEACMAHATCEVFKACYHGNVCLSCARSLPNDLCPTCCATIREEGQLQTIKI